LDLWRRDAIVRTAADPNRHIDKLLRGMKFVITQAQAVIVQPGKENPRMFTVAVFGSSGPSSALSFAPSESPANATSHFGAGKIISCILRRAGVRSENFHVSGKS
jgi:hypothetical protein